MNEFEKMVHDYIMECYEKDDKKVLEKEYFHEWFHKNQSRYHIEDVFFKCVTNTILDMAINSKEENKNVMDN